MSRQHYDVASMLIRHTVKDIFLLPMRQSLFYFSGAGKFYLVHGLSSHETLKGKSFVYKRSLRAVTKTPNDVRSWPSYTVIVNIFF